MDFIDAMYANEMWKRQESHATYIFQMQNGVKNDPYVTENAWKYEVYAYLREVGKKVPEVSEGEIMQKANSITDLEKRERWLYAWALILSEFYGMPLRMAYDRESYNWVPEEQFRMMKEFGRVWDAYYKYQIQEQWELTADGKVKQLEPVRSNEINKVDIDATDMEIKEWQKILTRLENMLKNETIDERKAEIQKDIQRAKKALNDLSSK